MTLPLHPWRTPLETLLSSPASQPSVPTWDPSADEEGWGQGCPLTWYLTGRHREAPCSQNCLEGPIPEVTWKDHSHTGSDGPLTPPSKPSPTRVPSPSLALLPALSSRVAGDLSSLALEVEAKAFKWVVPGWAQFLAALSQGLREVLVSEKYYGPTGPVASAPSPHPWRHPWSQMGSWRM